MIWTQMGLLEVCSSFEVYCMFLIKLFNLLYLKQAGKFIIEYCGEVISWKEAKKRSHAYEVEGGLIKSWITDVTLF